MDRQSFLPLPGADADQHPQTVLPCAGPDSVSVPAAADGQRLDRVLADLTVDGWPRMGLRGWRRACEHGQVSVNGRPAVPGLRVRAGQQIAVSPVPVQAAQPSGPASGPASFPGSGPTSLSPSLPVSLAHAPQVPRHIGHPSASGLFAAVFKPAGWHSVRLAGGGGSSVEAWLGGQGADLSSLATDAAPSPYRLLNRLDQLTSGLLVVAREPAAPAVWARHEAAGRIDKWYLTVVAGALHQPFVARQALNTDDRRTTRVLHKPAPIIRRTAVTPLLTLHAGDATELFPELDPATEMTLVLCRIRQGARHQIRAHLAAAGYPLIGDQRYGSPHTVAPLLHHIRLIMPDWQVDCPLPPPFWPSTWTLDELTLGRELLSPADE